MSQQAVTHVHTNTCTQMFTAALFTAVKKRKQPKRPPIGEWINKMQYIPTTKYYWTIKGNEVLIYATARRNLERVTTSERRQTQRPWTGDSLVGKAQSRHVHRDRLRTGQRPLHGGRRHCRGHGVSFGDDDSVLELHGGDGCTTLWTY